MDGTHLCMVRLELLRLNTMSALDHERLSDVSSLAELSGSALRDLGRLAYPMRRRKGETGFTRVTFEEAFEDIGQRWGGCSPERTAMYVTSRGVTNEVYYMAQKVMRFLGSPNVDNSARLCHSPSTVGLKKTLGVAATTCSYKDWYDADLIVFFGSNPANDQPVATKYLVQARRNGARVLTVNAYKEPGMERYWVPSDARSALFGSQITDRFFLVNVGGDLAFVQAVAKVLVERGGVHQEFIEAATSGYEDWEKNLDDQSMDDLLAACGLPRTEIEAFVEEMLAAEKAVFVWSMGITQHAHGSDTVTGLVNLGLLREYVGRPGTGMMPIRGHSGVQGGAEMGAYATAFPGGVPVTSENASQLSDLWGFSVPDSAGWTTVDCLEEAGKGNLEAFWIIGGNFLSTMPEPENIARALGKISLRVHTDIVLTKQMFVEPADTVYLLPSQTRYEQKGGGTETTTERRVVFSPHIPGHQVGEASCEWEMLLRLAKAVRPEDYDTIHVDDAAAIRGDIARTVPFYKPIEGLVAQGDQFQWGGERLCTGRTFGTDDGKAHFVPLTPPGLGEVKGEDAFILATRRGKQFNSMVQKETDPLTGADRDHILMSHGDAKRLGLKRDDPIVLKSRAGRFAGRVFPVDLAPGTLQGHFPEVNVLLSSGSTDEGGGVPDYNAEVTIES